MRISNLSTLGSINRALEQSRGEYHDKQIRISSGKKFTKRSDDPATTSEIQRLGRNESQTAQWQKNIKHGLRLSQVSTAKIDEILSRMHRINELTVEAGNGTQTQIDRGLMAEEVDSIIEDLIVIGNTKFNGSYIFSGTQTDIPPFQGQRDSEQRISDVLYQGNNGKRKIQVGDSTQIEYNINGGGPQGLLKSESSATDVFSSLIAFRDELRNGGPPTESTQSRINSGLDHVVSRLVDSGVKQSRLSALNDHLSNTKNFISEQKSDLEKLDMAKALTELSQLEASFQASLQMAARINQLSLSNYI